MPVSVEKFYFVSQIQDTETLKVPYYSARWIRPKIRFSDRSSLKREVWRFLENISPSPISYNAILDSCWLLGNKSPNGACTQVCQQPFIIFFIQLLATALCTQFGSFNNYCRMLFFSLGNDVIWMLRDIGNAQWTGRDGDDDCRNFEISSNTPLFSYPCV